jgi:hypothetical protein
MPVTMRSEPVELRIGRRITPVRPGTPAVTGLVNREICDPWMSTSARLVAYCVPVEHVAVGLCTGMA